MSKSIRNSQRTAVLSFMAAAYVLLAGAPTCAEAGPLAVQFTAGYQGIRWGTRLAELRVSRPGGTETGTADEAIRTYELPDERPLFGIDRRQMSMRYGLCLGNVKMIWLYFPYAQREALLHRLSGLFGKYRSVHATAATSTYEWPDDHALVLTMHETRESPVGVAVSVMNIKEALSVNPACGLTPPQAYGERHH